MKIITIMAALAVFGAVGSAYALNGTVPIGVMYPGDDPNSNTEIYAPEILAAQQFAASEFNNYLKSKDAGWQLVLVPNNTMSDAATAQKIAEYYQENEILMFTGPTTSEALGHIRDFVTNNTMLAVSCCSAATSLNQSDMIYRLLPDDTTTVGVLVERMAAEGIKNAIILYRDDAWGNSFAASFTSHNITTFGGNVTTIPYDVTQANFTTAIPALLDVASDAVNEFGIEGTALVLASFSESADIIKAANSRADNLGQIRWYGTNGNVNANVLTGDPDISEFTAKTGFRAVTFELPDNTISRKVLANVSAAGIDNTIFSYSSYDAVWAIGLAIERADSSDPIQVNNTLRSILQQWDHYSMHPAGLKLNAAGDRDPADVLFTLRGIAAGEWVDIRAANNELMGTILIGNLNPDERGQDTRRATILAVDDFNQKYLQDEPWKLKVVSYDTLGTKSQALEDVMILYEQGINITTGPRSSGNIAAIYDYTLERDMLVLGCCSTSPALVKDDHVYRFVPDDSKAGDLTAFILATDGIDGAIAVFRNDTYGISYAEELDKNFGHVEKIPFKLQITRDEMPAKVDELDMAVRDMIDRYGASSTAVVFIGFAQETAQFMEIAAERSSILDTVSWYGTDSNTKYDYIPDSPAALKFATDTRFKGPIFGISSTPESLALNTRIFPDGTIPSVYAYTAYDEVTAIGLAMLHAQSSDAKLVQNELERVAALPNTYLIDSDGLTLTPEGDLDASVYDMHALVGGEWLTVYAFNVDFCS